MGSRKRKQQVSLLLKKEDFENSLSEIRQIPPKQVISPLFSLFYDKDPLLKWRAISAMGVVVSALADDHMESARVVMRRLMWNLNDESGGIGWGSPEAMGDIMARHPGLAEEYHRILVSYINPDGNFIEYNALQQGVLWGIGRLINTNARYMGDSADFLCPYIHSETPALRGLAVWSARLFQTEKLHPLIRTCRTDHATFLFYSAGQIEQRTVASFL